jgi:hypothetical protein
MAAQEKEIKRGTGMKKKLKALKCKSYFEKSRAPKQARSS